MADPSKSDHASNAGQSCRECRRRKGKCDGRMPVCSVCQRYNRHCLYDKHSRSSLTRKLVLSDPSAGTPSSNAGLNTYIGT
jgi:hypothetical protein